MELGQACRGTGLREGGSAPGARNRAGQGRDGGQRLGKATGPSLGDGDASLATPHAAGGAYSPHAARRTPHTSPSVA